MTLDWSVVWTHRDALVDATGTTVLLAAATMAIALPCGACLAALRLYAWSPIRTIAACYVEFFRNLPLILVVYWAFYVLPILTGLGLSPFLTGLAALALNVTAYNAETFRADTSLVSVIAVTELAYVAMQVRAQTFRVLEMLSAMAVIYWLLGYPQAKLVDWIQRRYAVSE